MAATDFIQNLAPYAQSVSARTGIPASVILAQAGLESGWGKSKLSSEHNNFFGVKGKDIYLPTPEYKNGARVIEMAGFKKYDSAESSMMDYAKVLQNSRYKNAFQYTNDPVRFVDEVRKAGYATDPAYTSKIASIIKSNNLQKYDGINQIVIGGSIAQRLTPEQSAQVREDAQNQKVNSDGSVQQTPVIDGLIATITHIVIILFVAVGTVWAFGRVFNVSVPVSGAPGIILKSVKGGK